MKEVELGSNLAGGCSPYQFRPGASKRPPRMCPGLLSETIFDQDDSAGSSSQISGWSPRLMSKTMRKRYSVALSTRIPRSPGLRPTRPTRALSVCGNWRLDSNRAKLNPAAGAVRRHGAISL